MFSTMASFKFPCRDMKYRLVSCYCKFVKCDSLIIVVEFHGYRASLLTQDVYHEEYGRDICLIF